MTLSILLALVVNLNANWRTTIHPDKGNVRTQIVDLPHNWDDYHGFRHLFHGNQHGYATYSKVFCARKNTGERQFLVFDGVGSFLTAKLNGVELCRRRPAGRVVTTLEVSDAIKDGENCIEVIADHPADNVEMPWICGGCGDCTCESPEPFGIFRDVRFETTGIVRLAPFGAHIWYGDDLEKGFFEAEIDFGNADASGYVLHIVSPRLHLDKSISCALSKDGLMRAEFALGKDVKRWSVETPNLYDIDIELIGPDGQISHSERITTGFRTIKWPKPEDAEHRFFLNGQPTLIHGVAETDHRLGGGIAFDPEEIHARVAEVKKLGFNAFREGHEPHDLRYVRELDKMGILHYSGFSTHVYFDTATFRSNVIDFVSRWVKERRNHPSVVIWGLQNESTLPVEFAAELTDLIKKLDPLTCANGRVVATCNWGGGTDWNVVQNWSGTYAGYGGSLMTYEKDLAKPDQLLNGEYGAWRLVGWHSDPDAPWDLDGAWTEEHQARVLYEKLRRAWMAHDKVCGQFLWTFFSHENPGRSARIDEGYRIIDKIGPVNHKGIYSIWGRRTESWYLYFCYGKYFCERRLSEIVDKPLSWWLAEGRRLAEPQVASALVLKPISDATYLHRLNCGGDRFVDTFGNVWSADNTQYSHSWSEEKEYLIEGYELNPVLASQDVVDGTIKNVSFSDAELFRTFRYGRRHLRFEFPVPTNSACNVELFFCDPGSYGRIYDVAINGQIVEKKLTPALIVPERNAFRRVYHVNSGMCGKIVVSFPRVQCNQAIVSAIAVSIGCLAETALSKTPIVSGYPECEGLTWAELSAQVCHETNKRRLPFGGESLYKLTQFQALPIEDRDGMHRAWYGLYVAGNYAVYFRVRSGDPVGKIIYWKFEDEKSTCVLKSGKYVVRELTPEGYVRLPVELFVNAGVYTFSYRVDGDNLSLREMRE